jgi:two-component system CheB/CheR fusion protein
MMSSTRLISRTDANALCTIALHSRQQNACTTRPSRFEVIAPTSIFVVDCNRGNRETMQILLQTLGHQVEVFADGDSFLRAARTGSRGCLLVEAAMPGMSGTELIENLHDGGYEIPAIVMGSNATVQMAVRAMKAGATDFIEKPLRGDILRARIKAAIGQAQMTLGLSARRKSAERRVAGLTIRQHQILELVRAGHPSKIIAADLGISQRTVDNHRAAIMRKTGSKSIPALMHMAFCADSHIPGLLAN